MACCRLNFSLSACSVIYWCYFVFLFLSATVVLTSNARDCRMKPLTFRNLVCNSLCGLANNKFTVFWVPTPYSFVGRYRRFGGICCHISQGKNALKTEAKYFSETLVRTYQTTRRHILQGKYSNLIEFRGEEKFIRLHLT
jgi:hypothetical protein